MTKESILVTGGDGNIGSEVINQLSSTGADLNILRGVRSLTKKKSVKRHNEDRRVEMNFDSLENCCARFERYG
jgi:nucleoside-diphosphate-sugar epimerase